MTCLRIIGVGSPFGSDHSAWQVIDALQEKFASDDYQPGSIEFVKLDRPGSQLIEYLQAADRVIVIDALAEDREEGVVELSPQQLQEEACLVSSHGFGVAEALQLAQAMQTLPAEIRILGLSPSLAIQNLAARCSELLHESIPGNGINKKVFDAV